jgi:hypothetical protein
MSSRSTGASSVIVDLDAENRIRGTKECWQLERACSVKGEIVWKAHKYFVTFAAAVREAYRQEIRTHHAHGIGECLAAAEELLAKYKTVLDELDLPALHAGVVSTTLK